MSLARRRVRPTLAGLALTDDDNGDDAMTSVRLSGRYNEPDLGLKEHTMGQVIGNASYTGHRC